jgi:cytochrome c oxidase accessory protein FixG
MRAHSERVNRGPTACGCIDADLSKASGMSTTIPTHGEGDEQVPKSLFMAHEKVYPKSIAGKYRKLKWIALVILLAIYYIVPWLRWDRGPTAPDQAVLVDLNGPRLYFFIEIWPQEIYYLTGLLIMAAIGLFLATSLAGRIWCGYACPQTVWTDLYVWVERKIEGDRSERIRLDKSPLSKQKVLKKLSKHLAWLAIAFLTGGAWAMYFTDAPSLTVDLLTFQADEQSLFFIGLFTSTTYLLGGWAREQVCTYMCPWPRLQGAMIDEDSLVVTYESWRGEPRGAKRKAQDWDSRGDCIDCKACIHVCPTGIDIRNGLQMECIGCGLCVDACNEIMARIDRPLNLVTFDTHNNQVARSNGSSARVHLIRPRTIIYGLIIVVLAGMMAAGLIFRPQLDISVLRDRAPLFVTLSDGDIRNGYTFKISNMTRYAKDYSLQLAGVPGATLAVIGQEDRLEQIDLAARPDTVATYRIYVRAPAGALAATSTPVTFTLTDKTSGNKGAADKVEYHSVFIGPDK